MCYLSYFESVDGFLQPVEEARSLETVHLGVVELERDGQGRFEQFAAVFTPGQERIGKQFGIDARHTVNLAFRHRQARHRPERQQLHRPPHGAHPEEISRRRTALTHADCRPHELHLTELFQPLLHQAPRTVAERVQEELAAEGMSE